MQLESKLSFSEACVQEKCIGYTTDTIRYS